MQILKVGIQLHDRMTDFLDPYPSFLEKVLLFNIIPGNQKRRCQFCQIIFNAHIRSHS